MNFARSQELRKLFLWSLPSLFMALAGVLAHFDFDLDLIFPKPRINIIGKWRAISNPIWTKNHTYEFFADGRYIEKCSRLEVGGSGADTVDYWNEEDASGRYELSSNNVLTLGTESAAWNDGHPERVDTNAAMTTDSYSSSKLRVNGGQLTFGSDSYDPETWYRVKVGTSTAKPSHRGTMSKELKKGDKVEWDSSGGHSTGEVIEKVTEDTQIKGHKVRASEDDPQFKVKSDKSGKEAIHKPEELQKK